MRLSSLIHIKGGYMKRNLKGLTLIELIAIITTVVILLTIGIGAITQSRNKINSGVIVDKEYSSGFYSADYWVPSSHRLTIRGEKNGKMVEYSFEVDEATYNKYNIGESYP